MTQMLNVWDAKSVKRLDQRWGALQGEDVRSTFELATQYGDSFLDVACGMGRFYGYLFETKRGPFVYVGLDSSQYMLDLARERFPEATNLFVLHDVTEPFPAYPQRWDVVLCCEIFIHLLPEQQLQLIRNLAAMRWRRAVVTLQVRADIAREDPFDIQIIALKKRRHFYNVIQNGDAFVDALVQEISDINVYVRGCRDLVRGAKRLELMVERDGQ